MEPSPQARVQRYKTLQRTRPKFTLTFVEAARTEIGLYKRDLAHIARVSIVTIDRVEAGIAVTKPVAFRLFNALAARYREQGKVPPFSKSDIVEARRF